MSRLLKTLCITLLLAFAVGTVVQTGSVGAMASQIAVDEHGAMSDALCEDCPGLDGHAGAGCTDGCASLTLAALPAIWDGSAEPRALLRTRSTAWSESRGDPPAFTPPRQKF